MDTNKYLAWAEALCSRREYCVQELRIKLSAKGAAPEETERVINSLVAHGFLNEERYAKAFVHDKSSLQGWGEEKIRYALRAKKLPDGLINQALANIDPVLQTETLRRLLETKRRSVKATSETDLRAKLIRFALSRGFPYAYVVAEVARLQKGGIETV